MREDRNGPADSGPSDDSTTFEKQVDVDLGGGLGGFLGKLGGLVEKLGELAETGQTLRQSGEIRGLDPKGKARGVYGLSIKTGLGKQGEEEVRIEPFGNIHRQPTGEPVFDDVREPLVDLHEEEDHILVLAEIPGVSEDNVRLDLAGRQLSLSAQRGEIRYGKEVTLPEEFSQEQMTWQCKNGILKIRFSR